jgi:hypothetical protein
MKPMNKIKRLLWLAVFALALSLPASLQAYSYCGGDPVNLYDPDGRCARGMSGGYNGSSVAGNASGAYMFGYYMGGITAGLNEGAQGGASITANTFSFGGSDAMGWTDSGQYQGAEYTGSRILSTVGRESLITAATFGTAQLARGGSQAALYGYQGLQVMNAGRSGYQIGTGINQVENGNNWGYVNIAGGTLGVVGSTSFAAGNPGLNSLAGIGPSGGGFAQSSVTWWNSGSAGDAAFQKLSFTDKVRSEVGMKSLTDGQFAPIQNLSAVDRGGQLMGNGIGGTLNGVFSIQPRQIVNMLGTGPSPGARLGIPPGAFIGSGGVNIINSTPIPQNGSQP